MLICKSQKWSFLNTMPFLLILAIFRSVGKHSSLTSTGTLISFRKCSFVSHKKWSFVNTTPCLQILAMFRSVGTCSSLTSISTKLSFSRSNWIFLFFFRKKMNFWQNRNFFSEKKLFHALQASSFGSSSTLSRCHKTGSSVIS
jgi:hypothetical protein